MKKSQLLLLPALIIGGIVGAAAASILAPKKEKSSDPANLLNGKSNGVDPGNEKYNKNIPDGDKLNVPK